MHECVTAMLVVMIFVGTAVKPANTSTDESLD